MDRWIARSTVGIAAHGRDRFGCFESLAIRAPKNPRSRADPPLLGPTHSKLSLIFTERSNRIMRCLNARFNCSNHDIWAHHSKVEPPAAAMVPRVELRILNLVPRSAL
jgi:hypothetical protein